MSKTDELVALSGVSRSTVFRFLRGDSVRPQARSSILAAMQRLNLQPDAHPVHRGSTVLIAIRPGFKSFKGYDISISGFIDRAEAYGFHVQLQSGNAGPVIGNSRKTERPAGVLFLGKSIEEEERESARLREAGVPHVFVNRMFDDPAYSWVSVDHREAAREAVAYLLGLGFEEVGTWGVTSTYRIDRDKRLGYVRAHQDRGLPVPPSCLDDDVHGDLEPAVQRLIDRKCLPRAWFAASDEHAMRFIKIARDNGIAVPGDVAILGMDDVEPAGYFNPALSSVHIPFREAGAASFDILKRLVENPEEKSHRIVLRHHLVIRESCGSAASVRAGGNKKNTEVGI